MLTPQEAESHVFPKASFGGYNMLQVDAFLDSLIEDYRTLYQENASLKSKMKVLVEKVEEYRATEDAMRMTLHSAQKMADATVKEGEAKKQATYIGQLKDLYTAQIKYIGSLSGLNADGSKPAAPAKDPVVTVPPEQQEKVAQDIEASMAKIFDTPAEQPAAPASKSDVGDTRVFDQVKFGKDYEIE